MYYVSVLIDLWLEKVMRIAKFNNFTAESKYET